MHKLWVRRDILDVLLFPQNKGPRGAALEEIDTRQKREIRGNRPLRRE